MTTEIGTEGYDAWVKKQAKKAKGERVTLNGKRVRLYCNCNSKWRVDEWKKNGRERLTVHLKCEDCNFWKWTFSANLTDKERGY
jgi:hypothetical protein